LTGSTIIRGMHARRECVCERERPLDITSSHRLPSHVGRSPTTPSSPFCRARARSRIVSARRDVGGVGHARAGRRCRSSGPRAQADQLRRFPRIQLRWLAEHRPLFRSQWKLHIHGFCVPCYVRVGVRGQPARSDRPKPCVCASQRGREVRQGRCC
jgi:hypothetical protein